MSSLLNTKDVVVFTCQFASNFISAINDDMHHLYRRTSLRVDILVDLDMQSESL